MFYDVQAEKGKYLQEWNELGITRYNGKPLPKLTDDIKAWLIMPDDENGRTYLVYNNYNVLMKWNRSYYFALAVSHLADRIVYEIVASRSIISLWCLIIVVIPSLDQD